MKYETTIKVGVGAEIHVHPNFHEARVILWAPSSREFNIPFSLGLNLTPTEAKDLAKALTKAAKGVKDG